MCGRTVKVSKICCIIFNVHKTTDGRPGLTTETSLHKLVTIRLQVTMQGSKMSMPFNFVCREKNLYFMETEKYIVLFVILISKCNTFLYFL